MPQSSYREYLLSWKKNKFKRFMQVSIDTVMNSMKKAIIQEKNPKPITLWSNLF